MVNNSLLQDYELSGTEGKGQCCVFGRWNDSKHFNSESGAVGVESEDAALARELNELSFQEREKVMNDIHGILEIPEETSPFLASCFQEFDREIEYLPQKIKEQGLNLAMFLKPSLATDMKFKLIFLRADHYDAKKAARRVAKYFADKLYLFGEERLVQKITLEDLDKDDMDVYRSGIFTVLPHKDSVGRPIWFCDQSKFDLSKPKSMLRCSWYQMMAALEDHATQVKGVCNVQYFPSNFKVDVPLSQFWEAVVKGGEMLQNLPIRVTSYHFCSNSSSLKFVMATFRSAIGKQHRLRLRAHFGSGIEIQYSLMTYGIIFPYLSDEDGDAKKMSLHRLYTDSRQQLENQEREKLIDETNSSGAIPYPNRLDVLVGRGRPYQQFSGNKILHDLIRREYLKEYALSTTGRFEKTCMLIGAIKTVQKWGGRFMERTGDGWKVVDDKVARRKVNSAFRSALANLSEEPATATIGVSRDGGHLHVPPSSDGNIGTEKSQLDNSRTKRLRIS